MTNELVQHIAVEESTSKQWVKEYKNSAELVSCLSAHLSLNVTEPFEVNLTVQGSRKHGAKGII